MQTVIKKPSLLLTSTVKPSGNMPQLQVRDPEARLKQYCCVFSKIIENGDHRLFSRIIIAENSGYDMSLFKEIFSKAEADCKYVSLPALGSAFGRGFAEMTLIDQVLNNGDVLDDLNDEDLIWKVTGRYEIKNLDKIVACRDKADLIINVRKYPRQWADMHVFAFNRTGWSHLRKEINLLKEDGRITSAEISMFDVVQYLLGSHVLALKTRLPVEPHICGLRGSDGREYDSGKQRVKRYIRQIARLVAPGLAI